MVAHIDGGYSYLGWDKQFSITDGSELVTATAGVLGDKPEEISVDATSGERTTTLHLSRRSARCFGFASCFLVTSIQ